MTYILFAATINDFKAKAKDLCAMSYSDVLEYNEGLETLVKKDDNVKYYCFLSSYITVLLECKFSSFLLSDGRIY